MGFSVERLGSAMILLALAIPSSAQVPQFGHVFIVLEENQSYSSVIGNPSMPYLNSLASQYGLATNYYANTHPSIGNYFMLTTGQILTNDNNKTPSSFPVSVDNIVRELIAAGKSWKGYAECLPSVGYLGGNVTSDCGTYYVRHFPPPYFTDVQNSLTQQQNLVPFTQFATDLALGQLPNYSFITPNGCHDAHNCGLDVADNWLKTNLDPLIQSPGFQQDGLLIIVFDESVDADAAFGGGQVAMLVISPKVKPGYKSTILYQHQSTLRMVIEGLALTSFPGASATAPDMGEFFVPASGPAPAVSLSAASLSFGSQLVGTTSAPQSVTLTNTGNATLNITSIVPSGDYADTSTCGATLDASASCIISVTFTPATTGTRNGAITINDNATGAPHTITLSGAGTSPPAPAVSLSNTSLSFGSQLVGTTSAAQSDTLTNTGNAILSITSIVASGDFSRTTTCSSSLSAGSSCTISVQFTPTATGTRTGAITIMDNAGSGTQTINLTGSGTAPVPDFGLSATPSSRTVVQGSPTSYTVNTSVLNGFSGTVALSITSTLPAGVTTSFNPTSVAAGGSSTLNVTTSATTPVGTYTITIQGTSGSLTHTTSVTLTVNSANPPNFSISASPASRSVNRGNSTTYTVTITPSNGFNGSVSLNVSGLPSRATASFSPTSINGSGNSTMTVSTKSRTPRGTFTLTIQGTSGSLSHTTTVRLTVN
jgi:hypothetical protein